MSHDRFKRPDNAYVKSVTPGASGAFIVDGVRTSFFLAQIIAGNWQLRLPVTVHGYSLSTKNFPPDASGDTASAAGHLSSPAVDPNNLPETSAAERTRAFPANVRPPKKDSSVFEQVRGVREASAYTTPSNRHTPVLMRTITKSLWTCFSNDFAVLLASNIILSGLPRRFWRSQ